MSIKANFPDIKPSLMLDFANTKRLDPRITFTRATTATYYDGYTVAKAEENGLLHSQSFQTSISLRQTVATDDDTTAPDGTTTAAEIMDVITDSSTANTFVKTASIPPTIDGVDVTRTLSIFVKKGNYDYFYLGLFERTRNFIDGIVFDLSTNTITQTFGSLVDSSDIVSVGNSWYRVSVTVTGGDRTANEMTFGFASAATGVSITGDYNNHGDKAYIGTGTNYVYVWGMQLEARDTVTAYTPTTTQPITNYIPVLQSAASGKARFDHDPVTGESKGLLIEEQRTNLLLRSEEFDNAAWTTSAQNATVTANTIVAPDGTLTGDKAIETAASGYHFVQQNFNTGTAGTYVFSFHAKADGSGRYLFAQLTVRDPSARRHGVIINLSTGAVSNTATAQSPTGISVSVIAVGNGWYRIVMTSTAVSGLTQLSLYIGVANSTTFDANAFATEYTGDGYSGIYLWGAQLEAGAFPTSYIPTVASQVTRNADAASMTGANFSSWFRNDEFSLYQDIQFQTGSPVFFSLNNSNKIETLRNNTFSISHITAFGGSAATQFYAPVPSPSYPVSTFIANQRQVAAFSIALNSFASGYSGNGNSSTPTLNPAAATFTGLFFGGLTPASQPKSGHIKKLAFYPKALSQTELEGLTS